MVADPGRRRFLKALGAGGLFVMGCGRSLHQPSSSSRSLEATEQVRQADAIARLCNIASNSAIAPYHWANRGRAPAGYIKGMAVSYAKVYCELGRRNVY